GGATELTNTNKLLKRYAGINGLKTGTTGLAGVCISASAEREGLGLISVVLGSASSADRFAAATALLDYGFANFESAVFPSLSAYPKMLRVKNGSEQEVPLCYDVPETLLLKKGEGTALQATVQMPAFSTAPIENGTVLGTVTLAVGGEILGEYPITAEQTIPKMDFKHALELLLKAMITL
ncbi:MAG: D-alanyl-D-alanine carboxypeptidase, partial [Pygmaiobacter sp.]